MDFYDTLPREKWPIDALGWCATGSRVICNPPVLDTDEDYALWVSDFAIAASGLEADGWTVQLDDPEYRSSINLEAPFITARKGTINLIIFNSFLGYSAFEAATDLAKKWNLTDKDDRVALFRAVAFGRGEIPESTKK